MPLSLSPESRREALAGLRATLASTHRAASAEAFVLAEEAVVRTGFLELDAALGGGVPRGILATLEGPAASGRSAVAARLLAAATLGGLGAVIESPAGLEGAFYPPALAAAGVDLNRLLVVPAAGAAGVARAADILLRSAAFGVIVVPMVTLAATVWTRLASLTHRTNALLIALGGEASDELRYFASLRVRLRNKRVRWSGASGLFCELAGADAEATVLKHKRAAPGRRAHVVRIAFERGGPPFRDLRERELFTESSLQRVAAERILAV
jgi:recombination protein RecA